LLQRWLQLLARTAPRRPEVDQHRQLARFLDDVRRKACRGDVLHDRQSRGVAVARGRLDRTIADIGSILAAHAAERIVLVAHIVPFDTSPAHPAPKSSAPACWPACGYQAET